LSRFPENVGGGPRDHRAACWSFWLAPLTFLK
jgi:hypothetical protein